MTRIRSRVLIALGGNLPSEAGLPAQTLLSAIRGLAAEGLYIQAISRFYTTPCFPAGQGPDYINAAIAVHSDIAPQKLLALLHRIEKRFGRLRDRRWGGRTLDLDLLAAGAQVLPDLPGFLAWQTLVPEAQARAAPDRLILPHPRMQDRAFVLVPLADIAPDWVHPVLGQSVADMCAALPLDERDAIRPV